MPPGGSRPVSNGRVAESRNDASGGGADCNEGMPANARQAQAEPEAPPPPVVPEFEPVRPPDLIAVDTTSMQLQWQAVNQLPLHIPLNGAGKPACDAALIPPVSLEYLLETRLVGPTSSCLWVH